MKYFSIFPSVPYDVDKTNTFRVVPNLLKRFQLTTAAKNNLAVVYQYDIQDGDRPETLAEKYYGDPTLDWLIIHANEIINPAFDWPLTQQAFDRMIIGEYGSLATARATIDHYLQIIEPARTTDTGEFKRERTIIVDKTTYDSLPPTERRAVSVYTDLQNINESKRTINIIDKAYIQPIIEQAATIFKR